MGAFNEQDHPRHHDGRFAGKPERSAGIGLSQQGVSPSEEKVDSYLDQAAALGWMDSWDVEQVRAHMDGLATGEERERFAAAFLADAPRPLEPFPDWKPAEGVPRGSERYSRSYGGKSLSYTDPHPQGGSTVAQIAKAVRQDIKDAIKGGYLPGDLTYSVRSRNFAGGSAIDLEISGLTFDDFYDRERLDLRDMRLQRSKFVGEVESRAQEILEQYNWDGTDSTIDYFDVRFYGHTHVNSPRDDAWARREKLSKGRTKLPGWDEADREMRNLERHEEELREQLASRIS